MQSTEVIHGIDKQTLKDILHIENECFPPEWPKFDEAYYGAELSDDNNINICLKNNGERIGYFLAIPHNCAVEDLKDVDPEMRQDPMRYYIETVGILPQFQESGGFSEIFRNFVEECKKRGTNKVSMHARVKNGFNEKIKRKLKVTLIRRIEKWKYYNYKEPADYIEGSFNGE